MGQELQCTARIAGKTHRGKALLESAELIFRASSPDELRLKIPFREMKAVRAVGNELCLKFPRGDARFAIGPAAARWAQKILHPPSRLDKLGVKPGLVISLFAMTGAGLGRELAARTGRVHSGKPRSESDLLFFGAEKRADLARVRALGRFLKKSGALWIVYPKGRKEITEGDVLAAGRAVGLTDIKVVSFSPSHTALKFVLPLARR